MINIGTAAHYISATLIQRLLATALLSSVLMGAAVAQGSVLDGSTPPGLAPGTPAGSYALSDLDNINLFNGHLNFRLPLLTMGGRGSAGYTMMLKFQRKWVATHAPLIDEHDINYGTLDFPSDAWWQFAPNYSPGQMDIRQSGVAHGCISLIGVPDTYYATTLTRLTFTAPDGTEFELRDQLTGGKPLHNSWSPCNGTAPVYPQRGSVFVTADGTSATFISDAPLYDAPSPSTEGIASGANVFLTLRDGTRYRIDSNRVSWVRDRNGNKVSFTYHPVLLRMPTAITDSLNRQVTIAYRDPQINIPYDQITYKGFGGATRTIRVHYTQLSQALRADYSPQQALSDHQLFPELNAAFGGIYDPLVVSSVELPDGRRYRFYYNHYGELTRAELPTGGAIEYDYTPGSGVVGTEIIRSVIARRVYPNGGTGSDFEGQTTYHYNINPTANMTMVVVNQLNPSGALLSREKHYFHGTIWNSFGLHPVAYAFWRDGKEYQTERLDTNDPNNPEGGTVLQRVSRTWQQRAPVNWWQSFMGPEPANDPRIVEAVTTLADANLVSKQTFGYDQYNNQTAVYEYDFGAGAPGPLIRRMHTDYVTFNNGVDYAADTNIHIRNLPLQQQTFDVGGIKRAEAFYEYDYYNSDGFHAPLIDRPNISGHDGAFWAGHLMRGNVTKTSRALLNNSGGVTGWVDSHAQYDIAGNVVKVIDAKGNPTQFDFRDNFGSPDDPEVQSSENPANNAPGELGGQMSYASPFKTTNALGHKAYTKYDYYLGRPVLSEDINNIKSSVYVNDALDRPTRGVRAIGTAVASQIVFVYNDSGSPVNGNPAHSITTISDKDVFGESNGGNGLKSLALYDGLGKTWRSAAYEGSTNWTIKDTKFDALGRDSQVSSPYRATDPGSASPPSGLWTTTEYDSLGRAVKVTTPDSAHFDTAYNGNQVTVTDQAGKKRRSETDALGRLVKVIEDPGGLSYATTYFYDPLDNLRAVSQGGQGRWFAYDSLSRLIRVRNPEQDINYSLPPHTDPVTGGSGWSMAYSYDANGNLVSKIDASNITTNYTYDALNRNTTVDYSNTTALNPDITRHYDNPNPLANGGCTQCFLMPVTVLESVSQA